MVVFTMERMLQAIAGIAGALILTVSFFRAKAVKEAFLWMNSPLFTIVFLAGILGFTALASWVEERVQNMAAELSERATFGNPPLELYGTYGRRTGTGAGYPCL